LPPDLKKSSRIRRTRPSLIVITKNCVSRGNTGRHSDQPHRLRSEQSKSRPLHPLRDRVLAGRDSAKRLEPGTVGWKAETARNTVANCLVARSNSVKKIRASQTVGEDSPDPTAAFQSTF